jgi:crotonobetainyl-CoA:carnitine CoA-transferase CaiB-like acyl-CoA transferase
MKPLDGIKVVEVGTHVVVPIAARTMADWGARVIKVEGLTGDPWRSSGRAFNLPIEADANPSFSVNNSGKELLSLDLKSPEGKEILFKILEDTDIFISNVRWGAIQRLGLDWDTLHAKFPRLIYFHFNGFGYEGDYKDRPGFDSAGFWSMSGILNEFGERGARPVYPSPAMGDVATSGTALSGILAALYHREKTGEGIRLTTSLFANGIWVNYARVIGCQPNRSDGLTCPVEYPRMADQTQNPLNGVYLCKDNRWMLMASVAGYSGVFKKVMTALGLEQYIDDERFNTEEKFRAHGSEMFHLMDAAFKAKTAKEWDVILTEIDIIHQELLSSSDIAVSEQAWANDYLTNLECPNGNTYVLPNSPVTFYGLERAHTQHTGGVGADTVQILTELNYSEEQIKDLLARKVALGNL